MTDWTDLDGDSLDAEKILRTSTMHALYENPAAIAERATDAPVVQVPVREYKTSGTGATWTIPDGVTAFTVTCLGGGQLYGMYTGTASSITYNSLTYSAGGGGAGAGSGTVDIRIKGDTGFAHSGSATIAKGGTSPLGLGFCDMVSAGSASGKGYGSGGANGSAPQAGAAGELFVKRFTVVPGQTTVTYTVGTGGVSGGNSGGGGLIIFEY